MFILELFFRLAELISAIVGTIFISKYRANKLTRYFVYFLWLNFFIEIFGKLPGLIKTINSLSFLKGTFLEHNMWMYNIYTIFGYVFYIIYFKYNLHLKSFKKILNLLLVVFFISSVVHFSLTDVFFKRHSFFPMIIGTFSLLIAVFFYFYEILRSDKILDFNKDLVFYVAIGALVFHLCAPPLFIYSGYYNLNNMKDFVQIRRIILYSAIIFMYTCYTIGFIVCFRKNKSY